MPELISFLKHTHGFNVHVRHLEAASVLVSPRMAIERTSLGKIF